MKKLILYLVFGLSLFPSCISAQSDDSSRILYIEHNGGGDRTRLFSRCDPAGCPGNLINDPGFEALSNIWWMEQASITTLGHRGVYSMIACSDEPGGASQIVEITPGVLYSATVYALVTGVTSAEAGLRFLDQNYNLISGGTKQQIDSDHFLPYYMESRAPAQARYAEVWSWKREGDCLIVDDWCMLPTEPDYICHDNLLLNGNFSKNTLKGWEKIHDCAIVGGIAKTCIALEGGAFQIVHAESGYQYKLQCKAQAERGFDAFLSLEFLDSTQQIIETSYQQLVHNTAWQSYLFTAKAPDLTHFVRVAFRKSGGPGCFQTDDWCLTVEDADRTSNRSDDGSHQLNRNLGESSNLTVMPNPAKNKAILIFSGNLESSQPLELYLLDALGKVRLRTKIDPSDLKKPFVLSWNDLPGGLYWVVLTQPERPNLTRKLVILHD